MFLVPAIFQVQTFQLCRGKSLVHEKRVLLGGGVVDRAEAFERGVRTPVGKNVILHGRL